ncbi:MAG: ATP-binding cassette domain-containing protein [Bacteroidales bacterium]|nr:ATP-binding cassette domain-containing protein [Bacteroidales bacterium]
MNESILKALMKLFALVANSDEDGQAGNERDIVIEFLQQQFSSELVDNFIEYFDRQVLLYNIINEEESPELELKKEQKTHKRLKELCDQLNEELQSEQKVIVLINLLDFIFEDKKLSSRESQFVDSAAAHLKLEKQEFNDLKLFAFDRIDEISHRENLLFIDSSKEEKPKIKHIAVEKLDGSIRVFHIQSTNTFAMRYKGNDPLLLNGHSIRTNRTYIWSVGSVVKNQKIGSVYYTWVSGKFIQAKAKAKFVFTAKDIEYSYGNSPNGLKRFTLTEESGRLIGIIGGSGSGKSTLLRLLCGDLKPKRGTIAINGMDIVNHKEKLKGLIGYVPQDDFLIKELTVFQNLYYNAKLCFSNYSEKQIIKVVENSLIDFDLLEARDLRVGDSITTFLSGGQRKRLNIALELMREPSILFVDEPTSGLSSADTEKVMLLLKRQTFKGKLILRIFTNLPRIYLSFSISYWLWTREAGLYIMETR